MRIRCVITVALLGACGSDVAPDEGVLCPSCVPLSGGETSDFGGGSECAFEERAIPDERELQDELAATLAAYAGDFERPLRWSSPEAEATTLRGSVALGDGSYFVGDPVECGDFVQVGSSVVLETADGALRATSEGTLTLRRMDGGSYLEATSDLSMVRGTLDLHVDGAEPHVGRLSTTIVANADGLSGTATLEVSYFADRESAEAFARGEQAASTSEFRVVGTF